MASPETDPAGAGMGGQRMREQDMRETENSRWYESAAELLRLAVPSSCLGLTPYDSRRFARFLATAAGPPPNTRTLLLRAVVSDERLVGVADWRLLGHVLFLNGLAVAPDQRGSGIGRALLDDGIEVAQRLGCRFLELDVEDKNEPAQSLYRSVGFEMAGASAWIEVPTDLHPPRPSDPAWSGEAPALAEQAQDEHGWRFRNWPAFLVHHRSYGFGDLEVMRNGKSATVRLLPGGWRVSDATYGAEVAEAVASAVGRWPERVYRIARVNQIGDGKLIATFLRLRLPL